MVQVFELETKLNGTEDIQQYHSLVAELGLDGQKAVITDTSKEPVPYLWANTTTMNIVETLCNRSVDVADYKLSPIPIEVLEVIKNCKDNNYFHTLRVHYTDVDPDPFLIGSLGGYFYRNGTYSVEDRIEVEHMDDALEAKENKHTIYNARQYVLARWGDEAKTWDELALLAKKKFMSNESNEANKKILEGKRMLKDLESQATERFGIIN